MKRAEANFTALMEAIGGFVCRIGDWVSIIYGHIKGVLPRIRRHKNSAEPIKHWTRAMPCARRCASICRRSPDDAAAGAVSEAERALARRLVPNPALIRYCAADGQVTERIIEVAALHPYDGAHLHRVALTGL
jgi:hypothetical protein